MFKIKHRVKSIQTVISMSFSCLIVSIIFLIGLISYYVTGSVVAKNSGEYTYQLVEQVKNNIEHYLNNVDNISKTLYYNQDIQDYLASENPSAADEMLSRINQYLITVSDPREDILNIFIFLDDGRIITNRPNVLVKTNLDYKETDWYREAMTNDRIFISPSHVQNIIAGEYKWVVSVSRVLKDSNGDKKGLILIDLNFKLIEEMVSKIKLGRKGYVFIIDDSGNIIYHPQQQLLYSNLKSEGIFTIMTASDGNIQLKEGRMKKQYSISHSNYSGWKVVGTVYIDEINEYRAPLGNFFLILGLICLTLAISLSIIISKQIFYPIKKLVQIMNRVDKTGLDVIHLKGHYETEELVKAFNSMVERLKALMLQNQAEQEQKRKNELKALQAQINPHFLYNTLDSIVWMAEARKFEQVTHMTSSLAKFFRTSLSKGKEIITIGEEISHVIHYLAIQKMRYADKLDYTINVDEAILSYGTIKLILQPIVENAIYHGIKNMADPGRISIAGSRIENMIELKVIDNGVGMSSDMIEQIYSKMRSPETDFGGSGVGLKNVDERVKIYFGQEFGVTIESEIDEGTTVTILLPVWCSRGGDAA